jgi:hypothetical protein
MISLGYLKQVSAFFFTYEARKLNYTFSKSSLILTLLCIFYEMVIQVHLQEANHTTHGHKKASGRSGGR